MPLPKLIHPVQVTVERLVRSELVMDDDARAPVHGVRTNEDQTYVVPAQIGWGAKADPDDEANGVTDSDTGYILCRLIDLDLYLGTGQRFQRGDRIVAMGVRTGLDLYLTGKELPMGHYPDQEGQSMMRYYFEDRRPVRSTDTATVDPGGTPMTQPPVEQTSGEQSFSFTWPAFGSSAVVEFPVEMADASYIVAAVLTDPNGGLEAQVRGVRNTRTTTQVTLVTTGGESLALGAIVDIVLRDA